jgi:hypothetical protein
VAFRDKSGVDDEAIASLNVAPLSGVRGLEALQYPIPGFRWRSSKVAEDCTLRSSSRKVCIQRDQNRSNTTAKHMPYCSA